MTRIHNQGAFSLAPRVEHIREPPLILFIVFGLDLFTDFFFCIFFLYMARIYYRNHTHVNL